MISTPTSDAQAIQELGKIVNKLTGVQLDDRHALMVESRVQKRISELGLKSLTEYLSYFHANTNEETPKLISLLTTHHTYFLREFSHFEYMTSKALPSLVEIARKRAKKEISVWSAACSRGQEVYSLAMVLDQWLKTHAPDVSYKILGTDVDPESVTVAKNGVYSREELKSVPLSLMGDHWVRGTGDIAEFVKAKKSLRDHCSFEPGNLLAMSVPANAQFDLIFCRNVFIYFTPTQIHGISNDLLKRLTPEGYFMIGISETLNGLRLPVSSAGPSIYRHPVAAVPKAEKAATIARPGEKAPLTAVPTPALAERAIRVLCVDDSPSIHTLMKQILKKEEGFEIVGHAKSGLEAAKIALTTSYDVMTLDIHMPEQGGLEYLAANYRPTHPPVVMVTSVSRDNSDLALKALELGASDYVEKPAMANLAERAEEIRTKLRCAFRTGTTSVVTKSLDRSFAKSEQVAAPDQAICVALLTLSDRKKLKALSKELQGRYPGILFLIEGSQDALGAMPGVLAQEFGSPIQYQDDLFKRLAPKECVLMDLKKGLAGLSQHYGTSQVSFWVFGEPSKAAAALLERFAGAQVLIEDLGGGKGAAALMKRANDIVPVTSYPYLSTQFFSGTAGATLKKASGG